jgi:hypothetical protein
MVDDYDPNRPPVHQTDPARFGIELRQTEAVTRPRLFQVKPASSTTQHGSWRVFLGNACAACAALGVVIWMSTRLHVDPDLQNIALFAHLIFLVLGLGAVLAADYFIVLWLVGRAILADVVRGASWLHLPIWVGVIGLVFSGMLLEPNIATAMTRAKLVFVAVLILNGLQATILDRRMEASTGSLSVRLLIWSAATTALSQVCWWGSVWIGFWNVTQGH